MEERTKKLMELLEVFADEDRLLILCQPVEDPKTTSRLARSIPNIAQSALSQYSVLPRAHGILNFAENGQSITYRIKDGRVRKVTDILKAYYCKGEEK